MIAPMGEGRMVVRGDMLIANLNDLLEIDLPHESSRTVGGLVMEALGRVPQVGDVAEIDDIRLRVEAVAHHSVTAVCVALPEGAPGLPPVEVN